MGSADEPPRLELCVSGSRLFVLRCASRRTWYVPVSTLFFLQVEGRICFATQFQEVNLGAASRNGVFETFLKAWHHSHQKQFVFEKTDIETNDHLPRSGNISRAHDLSTCGKGTGMFSRSFLLTNFGAPI